MRQRMERLVILPFSAGCISEASVAVGVPRPRRSKSPNASAAPDLSQKVEKEGSKEEEDAEMLGGESMKNSSLRLLDVVSKPNLSNGFNRLFKGFKNFSQLFVEKEEELEEMEMEMEIGCPTDVQHVTHIGWDGITTNCADNEQPIKGSLDFSLIPPQLLSQSSLLHHFHLSNLDLDAKHQTTSSPDNVNVKPNSPN